MTRLDARERRLSLWAAAIGAAAWVALLVVSGFSGRVLAIAGTGLALAGLLALAARAGNRVVTGAAAALLGFWEGPFLGLPFVILAAWLLYRGSKARLRQREAAAASASDPAQETPAATTPAKKSRRPERKPTRDRGAPGGPQPSKRYTPPQRRP